MANIRSNGIRPRRLVIGLSLALLVSTAQAEYQSHPPMRALPIFSNRPLEKGPAYFVDNGKGDDRQDGSLNNPWKSINEAIKHLKPGDTLCLRGGTYYEHVTLTASGTEGHPITIRSYPGELARL